MLTHLDFSFSAFPFFLYFERINIPPDTPALRTLSQVLTACVEVCMDQMIGQVCMSSDRTRRVGHRLHQGRFRLDIQENFFPRKVVKH